LKSKGGRRIACFRSGDLGWNQGEISSRGLGGIRAPGFRQRDHGNKPEPRRPPVFRGHLTYQIGRFAKNFSQKPHQGLDPMPWESGASSQRPEWRPGSTSIHSTEAARPLARDSPATSHRPRGIGRTPRPRSWPRSDCCVEPYTAPGRADGPGPSIPPQRFPRTKADRTKRFCTRSGSGSGGGGSRLPFAYKAPW